MTDKQLSRRQGVSFGCSIFVKKNTKKKAHVPE
jgi:hypothetical protein